MKLQIVTASIFSIALASSAWADVSIVSENFDTYADTAAMQVAWPGANGALTSDATSYPGISTNAAFHPGGAVSEYAGFPAGLVPTASQNIVLAFDIFDDGNGNSRMTVGMRSSSAVENLLEMGQWNDDDISYAYRLAIWFGTGDTGWNFPVLNPGFDRTTDTDSIVNPADIAAYALDNSLETWHRWEATITPDSVTITLDLFRDGLTNDPLVPGNSTAGVDYTAVHTDTIATGSGFDSLRFGGASGLSSAFNDGIYDNITLDQVDVVAGNADFNGSGLVEGDDFLTWQQGFNLAGQTDNSNGDADGSTVVDGADLTVWNGQYGGAAPLQAGSALAAVPEPTTATLSFLALIGVAALTRKRK